MFKFQRTREQRLRIQLKFRSKFQQSGFSLGKMIKVRIISNLQEGVFKKKTGAHFNPTEEIRQYVSQADDLMTDYAFTMISVPKIGLNPQTSYNTPAGLYAYPLFPMQFDELLKDKLPFVSDKPYVGLIKLNKSAKWLMPGDSWIKGNFSEEEYLKFRDKLAEGVTPTPYDRMDSVEIQEWNETIAKEVARLRNHVRRNMNWDAKIFDLAYYFAKESAPFPKKSQKAKEKNGNLEPAKLYSLDGDEHEENDTKTKARDTTIKFRSFLVNIVGLDGVFDRDSGVVHESEPHQVVCLTVKSYSPVKIFETKDLRKKNNHPGDWKVDQNKIIKADKNSQNIKNQYESILKDVYQKELQLAKKREESGAEVKFVSDGIIYTKDNGGPIAVFAGSWCFGEPRKSGKPQGYYGDKFIMPDGEEIGFFRFITKYGIKSGAQLWKLTGWRTLEN